jgi:hypothetical protein
MTVGRGIAALAAGLALGALPFWRYAPLGMTGAPHADHEPWHGGALGMAGDHHVELRRADGRVEAWVSDAWRRPVRPREAWLVFDGGARVPLAWERDRLVAADESAAHLVEVVASLSDGTQLAVGFEDGGRSR